MSSRALRKLQREQEQEKHLATLRSQEATSDESEDEVNSVTIAASSTKPKLNAFDLLEGQDQGNSSEEDYQADVAIPSSRGENHKIGTDANAPSLSVGSQKSKRKKVRRTGKGKSAENNRSTTGKRRENPSDEQDMDEIDRALKELSTKDDQSCMRVSSDGREQEDKELDNLWRMKATKLLAIDSNSLNPIKEMKSLFGNIVLEGSSDTHSSSRNPRRREQNQQGGVDLATVLTGRYSVASKGKELGALASRRNVFMQGREEWPLATSGGLSMEFSSVTNAFERNYSLIHNGAYREVQGQFHICVESMQPTNLINLLALNPYHIATLLQVSEIAKHQGDHSVSGDLLERALFSLGRSVHSTFPAALRGGTARLSFESPANRELYLTIWRYIQNLSQRGTWRTAFEWAKVLLQFSTASDPYGMTLMIDQLALRGRQHAAFVSLCSPEAYGNSWSHLPNIHISLALAHHRNGSATLARECLAIAIRDYPFIFSALASALDISPLPKFLWGTRPSTDAEKLYTELYVTRTKDLWNMPETTSLIVEVAETMGMYASILSNAAPAPKLEVSLEEARHIMLLEIPSLIALLPRNYTNLPTSSADVLPPPDAATDLGNGFRTRAPAAAPAAGGAGAMAAIFNVAAGAGLVGRAGAWPEPAEGEREDGIMSRVRNFFSSSTRSGGTNFPEREDQLEDAAVARMLHEETVNASPEMHEQIEMVEQMIRMHLDNGHMPGAWEDDGRMSDFEGVDPDEDDEEVESVRHDMGIMEHYARAAVHFDGDSGSDSLPDLGDADTVIRPSVTTNSTEAEPAAAVQQRAPHAATVEDGDEEESAPNRPSNNSTPQPILMPATAHTVHNGPTTPAPTSARPQPQPDLDTSDPQRIQRWLVSTGLHNLQDSSSTLGEYVRRLKALRQRDRDWTINIVKQRAGAATADMVRKELDR